MSRHPYTNAADFVRQSCVDGEYIMGFRSVSMSRATASNVIENIAKEIGMEKEDLATILSNAFLRDTGGKE